MTTMLDALDRVLADWHDTDAFRRAVAETVARHGYATDDVDGQLRHVALRCRGRTMQLVLDAELGAEADLSEAPGTVLVLASGRMPGLAVEGAAAALAIGATALVRPSRDETVLHHLLTTLRAQAPQLAGKIELVGVGDEPPWERAEGAVVFGSDETIALVRDRLSPAAARHVAGYGSRQAIAVVAPGADVDPSWAERLADDVLAFRQAGCMSPSWLFLLGSREQAASLQEAVGRELIMGRDRHLAPGIDAGMVQRRVSDADVLGAIAAGMAPSAAELYAGDARLTVVRAGSEDELVEQVDRLGSLLQTAVIATGREDRPRIAQLLLTRTGVTRICLPGQAHEPDPLWPQDGIGRIAPLLGR
jgi:acyl-CoA reductase-like NAD-dependent aldehyde dehydrogenase